MTFSHVALCRKHKHTLWFANYMIKLFRAPRLLSCWHQYPPQCSEEIVGILRTRLLHSLKRKTYTMLWDDYTPPHKGRMWHKVIFNVGVPSANPQTCPVLTTNVKQASVFHQSSLFSAMMESCYCKAAISKIQVPFISLRGRENKYHTLISAWGSMC